MNLINKILLGLAVGIWMTTGAFAFAAGPGNSESTIPRSDCDCLASEEFSGGYVYVEPAVMAELNSRPLDMLADARKKFTAHKMIQASADIHFAAELMKIQAAGKLKGSQLENTAIRLENLSQRVAKREIN